MRQIILSILILCSSAIFADNIKRPDSYNYTRGIEAARNNNYDEALDYFNKEIVEHPDNGYAFAWIAVVRNYIENFGRALTAANIAVKKIPAKDKAYKSSAYSTRAKVYLNLEDTVQALKDYAQAISIMPEDDQIYNARAQVYYELGKYDLSDKDYQKMISLKEGDVMGYMGIGRNANEQKRYEDAIKQFDYVNKLAPEYSSAYSFRAESYIGLKKYTEAVDDVITALGIDHDAKAFYELPVLADSAFEQIVAKLRVQKVKEPNEATWPYDLGWVYECVNKYEKAIAYYKESLGKESNVITTYRIAVCYNEIGDFEKAVDYCNQAISLDTTNVRYVYSKANFLNDAGHSQEAIKTMSQYIAKDPENAWGYYRRGWFKDNAGDIDGAIEDYTMAITLGPDAYYYMSRGKLYQMKNEQDKAKADLLKAVELDSIPEKADCAHYAYYYLGNKTRAIEILNKVLTANPNENNYDAACLYSIMNEKEKAVSYLRKALENGYCKFAHIKCDRDLDNIRNTAEFKALLKEYEDKHQKEIASDDDDESAYELKVDEVPFTKEGGVCKVKCSINGLPLHFIFDTGAADVSISSVEATFMAKNDYLSSSDIMGKQNYMTADGNIVEGTVINLREVKFGSLHLNNIKASVTRNQSAPLLLGQSVLSKLGKIEIDNTKKVLRITHKQKIK